MKHDRKSRAYPRCEVHPECRGYPLVGFCRDGGGVLYFCDSCTARALHSTITDVREARRLREEALNDETY
jgi:hypothetical protein